MGMSTGKGHNMSKRHRNYRLKRFVCQECENPSECSLLVSDGMGDPDRCVMDSCGACKWHEVAKHRIHEERLSVEGARDQIAAMVDSCVESTIDDYLDKRLEKFFGKLSFVVTRKE